MASPERPEHLFVVRVWLEPSRRSPQWRAVVEHVASSERLYFAALAELAAFIRRRCEEQGVPFPETRPEADPVE